MAYRVSTETIGGRVVRRLHDDDSGASASIVPSVGFNLFDLRLPITGKVRPVLSSMPGFPEDPAKATRSGTPVLFPFPNRIRDARYSFRGQDYQLPANNGPNAIHGFAVAADWDVVEHGTDDRGAFVAGRYQISKQSPEMRPNWPADAVLELRYSLAGSRLVLDIAVSNPSAEALPFGFGIHPYFRLPFETGGDPAKAELFLPASKSWVLKDFLPTGERRPVEGPNDFREGRSLRGVKLDDLFGGLPERGGVCRLVDRALGAEFRLEFDGHFRELVVFTPPWFENCVAVEPYTQATDAINLEPKAINAGLRILSHDERVEMRLAFETRPAT